MGLRNCCLNHKDIDEIPVASPDNYDVKPNFKINLLDKILLSDLAESHKVKRYKIKHKKRLISISEDNTIYIFSFYLGNIVFLLNSFKVDDKYKIIKCEFLAKNNSGRLCLILEDLEKKCEILILKIERDKNIPHVELNLNLTNRSNDSNINQLNKKAIESIVNSSDSYDEEIFLDDKSEDILIFKDDDFFKQIPIRVIKQKYEDFILYKYGY